jgi:GGDEF domain-containing protein
MDERFIETMNNALISSKTIEALIISGPEGEYAFERQKDRAVTWVNNSPRFISRFDFSGHRYQRPLPIQNLRNANIQAAARAFSYAEFSKILKETLFLILIGFSLAFFTMLLQLLLGKSEEKTVLATVYTRDKPESVKETTLKDVENDEPGPKGLFSPRSNIGWEEYTKDRLDSELHRCASTEKDLTLIMVEFTNAMNDAMIRYAAEEAVSFFTSRDLLFEHGRQGITIIYPGIDLETGIAKAQKFHHRIIEKFPHSYKSNASFYIGLTSRSGRLLGAGRMMMEAMEALQRAKTDKESSIIAFKSDPDKYRKFIASQSPPMI